MRYRTPISILVAFALAFTSATAFAGKGQGGGGGNADRGQQIDRDRGMDRERGMDRDRMHDWDRAGDAQQDRDRDRIHMQDPSKIKDQDIYGNELMTVQERKQYRAQLGDANAQGGTKQFQAQHENKMQERALQQGQDLVPPGQGPVFGNELMTVQERNQYREQLRLCDSDEEHQKVQAQHRDRMNQRAHALGLEVEDAG